MEEDFDRVLAKIDAIMALLAKLTDLLKERDKQIAARIAELQHQVDQLTTRLASHDHIYRPS